MSLPISPIRHISLAEPMQAPGHTGQPGQFQSALESAIGRVEGARADAAARVDRFLSGEGEELHSTMMATQRAELEFEVLLQVRNKAVQAYQEIMRMQL